MGKFNAPMSLHAYLYCLNDPIDRSDPSGEISIIGTRLTGLQWGLKAYNAYSTAQSIRGYVKQLRDGISFGQVILAASISIGTDLIAGAAVDKILDVAVPAIKGLSKRLKQTKGHHPIPKWAGGHKKQQLYHEDDLFDWDKHQGLEKIIEDRMRPFGFIPKKGTTNIKKLFKKNPGMQDEIFSELIDIYSDFDKKIVRIFLIHLYGTLQIIDMIYGNER